MRDARYDIAEAKFHGIESSIKNLSKDEIKEKGEHIFMYLFTILMKMNKADEVMFAFSAMQSLTSVATGGSIDDNQKETIVNFFAVDIIKDIINGSEGAFWEEPGKESLEFVKKLLGVDADLATQMTLFMLYEAYSIGGDEKNIERIKDVYLEGTFDNVMSDLLNSGLVHMTDFGYATNVKEASCKEEEEKKATEEKARKTEEERKTAEEKVCKEAKTKEEEKRAEKEAFKQSMIDWQLQAHDIEKKLQAEKDEQMSLIYSELENVKDILLQNKNLSIEQNTKKIQELKEQIACETKELESLSSLKFIHKNELKKNIEKQNQMIQEIEANSANILEKYGQDVQFAENNAKAKEDELLRILQEKYIIPESPLEIENKKKEAEKNKEIKLQKIKDISNNHYLAYKAMEKYGPQTVKTILENVPEFWGFSTIKLTQIFSDLVDHGYSRREKIKGANHYSIEDE